VSAFIFCNSNCQFAYFVTRAPFPNRTAEGNQRKLTVCVTHAVQFHSQTQIMDMPKIRKAILLLFIAGSGFSVIGQPGKRNTPSIPTNTLVKIIRYEDQRNWNDELKALLTNADAGVRQRAVLAAGRIGDERAVPALAEVLLSDRDQQVRQMAAFALGETESPGGAYALTQILKMTGSEMVSPAVRARAVEALGKIVAAMVAASPAPASGAARPPEDDRLDIIKAAIVEALRFEDSRRSQPDKSTILLGLTAVLRSRPDGVGPLVARFLDYSDPEIVATALNTMARLRLKDSNESVRKLLIHRDPIVRANAARVIGAAEHKEAFADLLDRADQDPDIRVRASAIRSLATLNNSSATAPLLGRGEKLARSTDPSANSDEWNELLELATTLGRLNQRNAASHSELVKWLIGLGEAKGHTAVEVEIARARVSPEEFVTFCATGKFAVRMMLTNWRAGSRLAQGLGEIAALEKNPGSPLAVRATQVLRDMLNYRNSGIRINTLVAVHSEYAIPDVLQAYAAFKPSDLSEVARSYLSESDVIIRGTAAELLGQQPGEANTRALVEALPRALRDRDLNDAALAILDALGKQKNKEANDAIQSALNSDDHLIRRRALALLKTNGVGDFSDRIGLVKTRYTTADYRRAIARIGRQTTATLITSKGSFTIEFLPADAPLTVDNFVQLAKRGFFNGQTIPRVVPNFVVQDGDPRGDQNGGPGYQIRCEINEVPYDRGAVGMALSGKDTGGSQWFVTHSPQPHLDGGYTVFARVIRGMDVVDRIVRGDVIRRVMVSER
jgi:cyclophilin family peptidyl-prolyl cis-trans isomerase/HEAT repeat protein